MNARSIIQGSVLAAILAFALVASAADKTINTSVQLISPVQFNGQQLKAGNYAVKIVRNGSDAQVTLRSGKTVVTSHAQFVDSKDTAAQDGYLVQDDGGTGRLIGLKFYGKKEVLMLGGADAASGSGH